MLRYRLPILLATVWLTACASDPPQAISPAAPVAVEDKLDDLLGELLRSYESEGPAGLKKRLKAMKNKGVLHKGLDVNVEITASTLDSVPLLQNSLTKAGGRVDLIFENTMYGWIPIPELRHYAQHSELWTIKANIPKYSPVSGSSDTSSPRGTTHAR